MKDRNLADHPLVPKLPWLLVHFVLATLAIVFSVTTWMSFIQSHRLTRFIDFTTYYSALQLVINHPGSHLYNLETQWKIQEATPSKETATGFVLPYIHPPFELLLLLPLGFLPYHEALLCWLSVNLVLVISFPIVLRGSCSNIWDSRKWLLALTTYSFFPLYFCMWQGQDSILFLWILAGTFVLLKRGAEFPAGLVFGLAFMKFQIAYLLLAPLIFKRRTKFLLGTGVSLVSLALMSISWIGISGAREYVALLLNMGGLQGERNEMGLFPQKFQSWAGQLHLLGFKDVHSPIGAVLLSILGLCVLIFLWRGRNVRSDAMEDLRLAGTVLVAILASPYLYYHDLSAILLPLILCLKLLLSMETIDTTKVALAALLLISPAVWISPILYFRDVPLVPSVLWMTLLLFLLLVMQSSKQFVILAESEPDQLITSER